MPIYIYDKDAKQKMAEVEGEEWLRHQKHMDTCSFDAFYEVWHRDVGFRKDLMDCDSNFGISVDGNHSIYGFWGWNRYLVMFSGEIVFLAEFSIPENIEKARQVGFTIR